MGGLTIRYSVWGFLQSYGLSIREFAAVVDQGHRPNGRADFPGTATRFVDFASVDFDLDSMVACETTEEGDFHVWDDGGGADDQSFDAN